MTYIFIVQYNQHFAHEGNIVLWFTYISKLYENLFSRFEDAVLSMGTRRRRVRTFIQESQTPKSGKQFRYRYMGSFLYWYFINVDSAGIVMLHVYVSNFIIQWIIGSVKPMLLVYKGNDNKIIQWEDCVCRILMLFSCHLPDSKV